MNIQNYNLKSALRVLSEITGIPIKKLISPCRSPEFTWPRYVFFKVAYKKGYTYEDIASIFNRDHATCISGIKKYNDLMEYDKEFQQKCTPIFMKLTNKMRKAKGGLNDNKVYIHSCPLEYHKAINSIEEQLILMGYKVFNPVKSCREGEYYNEINTRERFIELLTSTHLYVIKYTYDDIEIKIALKTGIKIITEKFLVNEKNIKAA